MSAKKINPNGLCVKTLKICCQSTAEEGSLMLSVKWPKEGTVSNGVCTIPKNYGVPQNRERVYIVGYSGRECSGKLLPATREGATTISQVGNISSSTSFNKNPQTGRVYSTEGVSPTLNTCGGGNHEPKILINKNTIHNFGNSTAYDNENTVWSTGISRTLTATDYKHVPKVAIKNATKTGYTMAEIGDGIDLAYPDSETRRERVQPQRSNTLTTSDNLGVLVNDEPIRIRKLTPKECWRLQGFTDKQFERAAAVNSNSQLYKQAGNAVTVNVVEEIGRHIIGVANEETCKNK